MWNKYKRTAGRFSLFPVLALAFMLVWQPTFASAAAGKISLDLTYVAAGIGYQTGTATVTVGGKVATFDVKGAQFLGAGISTFHAEGAVNGAASIESIEGDYSTVRGSLAVIVGGVSLTLKNESGVTMDLTGTGSQGIDVSVGPGELTFTRTGKVRNAAGAAMNPCSSKNPCNPCSMKKRGKNPCNPCAGNACAANPCAMKKSSNPCNPCSMKRMNPCNPCGANPCALKNPCSMKNPCSAGNPCANQNTPIRKHAFDNFKQAAALGKKMWNDENLGTSGLACMSCHADHELLNLGKNQNYPHYVKMVGDVVSLDQMINFCMANPMKGKQFDKNSKELTAMGAYFRAYRMQYLQERRNK